MTQEDLKEIVARVTEEVMRESSVTAAQRGFKVDDLRKQVVGLGDGDLSAWEISYKTSLVAVGTPAGRPTLDMPSDLAWEISYKTSSVVFSRPGGLGQEG
jgi:hypothetical protein